MRPIHTVTLLVLWGFMVGTAQASPLAMCDNRTIKIEAVSLDGRCHFKTRIIQNVAMPWSAKIFDYVKKEYDCTDCREYDLWAEGANPLPDQDPCQLLGTARFVFWMPEGGFPSTDFDQGVLRVDCPTFFLPDRYWSLQLSTHFIAYYAFDGDDGNNDPSLCVSVLDISTIPPTIVTSSQECPINSAEPAAFASGCSSNPHIPYCNSVSENATQSVAAKFTLNSLPGKTLYGWLWKDQILTSPTVTVGPVASGVTITSLYGNPRGTPMNVTPFNELYPRDYESLINLFCKKYPKLCPWPEIPEIPGPPRPDPVENEITIGAVPRLFGELQNIQVSEPAWNPKNLRPFEMLFSNSRHVDILLVSIDNRSVISVAQELKLGEKRLAFTSQVLSAYSLESLGILMLPRVSEQVTGWQSIGVVVKSIHGKR